MHAWDQPPEVLFERGPKAGARLLMPRLGQPVDPDQTGRVEPWWRVAGAGARKPAPGTEVTLPKNVPWPID